MIVHQGENVIIGTFFEAITGAFNLADYDIKVVVTNLRGATKIEKSDNIVRNDSDNTVACTITSAETKTLKGLYFVSFELWVNGERVLSNNVEQLEVI